MPDEAVGFTTQLLTQRYKLAQKYFVKFMPVYVSSRLLHRMGQIEQLRSISSPGQGWLSASSTPGSLPYKHPSKDEKESKMRV